LKPTNFFEFIAFAPNQPPVKLNLLTEAVMTGGFLQKQWYAAALSSKISTDETFAYLTRYPMELKWGIIDAI
jgi:hypothetical protein